MENASLLYHCNLHLLSFCLYLSVMAVPATMVYFTLYDQLKYAMGFREGEHSTRFIPLLAGSTARGRNTTKIEFMSFTYLVFNIIAWFNLFSIAYSEKLHILANC